MSKAPQNVWPNLLEGDVLLTRNPGAFGVLIRFFEHWKSGEANASHAAAVIDGQGNLVESLVRVARSHLAKYDTTPARVWRNTRWSFAQRAAIAARVQTAVGEGYGWGKIALFALDCLVPGQRYPFTQLFGVTSFKVCSNLVAWAIEKETGNQAFGLPWRSVSPDAIDDWCGKHGGEWVLAHDSFAAKGESQS
jgi:hypothetical protein